MTARRTTLPRRTWLGACLVFVIGALALPGARAAVYSTINDDANDGLIRSDGNVSNTGGNPSGVRLIGSSSSGGIALNTAYFFELPDAGLLMSTTEYAMEFHYDSSVASPAYDADLYGLGFRPPTPALDGEWFFEGALDTDARNSWTPPTGSAGAGAIDLVKAGVIAPATAQDTRIALQSGALHQFIQSLYDDGAIGGPVGGDSAVFRFNADVDTSGISGQSGYNIVMDNSGGHAGDRAMLKALDVPFAADTFDGLTPGSTVGGAASGADLTDANPAWTNAWIESAVQPAAVVNPSPKMSFSNDAGEIDGRDTALEVHGAYDGNTALNNNAARRALDTPFTGDELYFRYILRPGANGLDSNDFFILWLDNDAGDDDDPHTGDSAYLGVRGGDRFFGRINSHNASEADIFPTGGIVAGEDYTLVGRLYRANSGDGFNRLDIWLNPEGGDVDDPMDTVIFPGTNGSFNSITHLGLRTGQFTEIGDTFLVDALALGTQWSQVVTTVPEPANLALWAVLLAGVPHLRRRRRA